MIWNVTRVRAKLSGAFILAGKYFWHLKKGKRQLLLCWNDCNALGNDCDSKDDDEMSLSVNRGFYGSSSGGSSVTMSPRKHLLVTSILNTLDILRNSFGYLYSKNGHNFCLSSVNQIKELKLFSMTEQLGVFWQHCTWVNIVWKIVGNCFWSGRFRRILFGQFWWIIF